MMGFPRNKIPGNKKQNHSQIQVYYKIIFNYVRLFK